LDHKGVRREAADYGLFPYFYSGGVGMKDLEVYLREDLGNRNISEVMGGGNVHYVSYSGYEGNNNVNLVAFSVGGVERFAIERTKVLNGRRNSELFFCKELPLPDQAKDFLSRWDRQNNPVNSTEINCYNKQLNVGMSLEEMMAGEGADVYDKLGSWCNKNGDICSLNMVELDGVTRFVIETESKLANGKITTDLYFVDGVLSLDKAKQYSNSFEKQERVRPATAESNSEETYNRAGMEGSLSCMRMIKAYKSVLELFPGSIKIEFHEEKNNKVGLGLFSFPGASDGKYYLERYNGGKDIDCFILNRKCNYNEAVRFVHQWDAYVNKYEKNNVRNNDVGNSSPHHITVPACSRGRR